MNELLREAATARDISDKQKLEKELRQAQKAGGHWVSGRWRGTPLQQSSDHYIGVQRIPAFQVAGERSATFSNRPVRDSGTQTAALTRQLLAFSRQSLLEPQVLDLNVVVAETEKMLRRLIAEDIVLSVVLERQIGREGGCRTGGAGAHECAGQRA